MKRVRARSLVIGGFFTLFFIILIMKLYWLQVVEASWLLDKAERNWQTNEILQPKRGTILDRNGKIMAQDAEAFTVALSPKTIHEQNRVEELVDGLASLLKMDNADGRAKLYALATKKREDGSFQPQVEVRNEGWKIDSDAADKIKAWINKSGLEGIYLISQQKRYYPANEMASHVLGYTNKEGQAVMGLEWQYDKILRGTPGSISYEKDLRGNVLPDAKVKYKPAEDGKTLQLTIDVNIQHFVEDALRKTYDQYKPKAAIAVAVDPMTLEVLGMANFPDFNPNRYWEIDSTQDFINHSIVSQYEPGSTFKIVTLAGAVQEGLFHPGETYQSGTIRVPGAVIHDHNNVGWGKITYLEGLKRSSNVAFVKLGYEGLGEQKLRDYIMKFGFGANTGIDLPGEVPGVIDFKWPAEVATATFGQGKVAVTAIQQLAAVSAIANGGKLMWPHLVKEIINPADNTPIQKIEPKVVRRVISPEIAHKVGSYLEQVVSDQAIGTGRRAYIDGYTVAGKTGTSQKVVEGGYSNKRYIVSFIGYAPVENPRIAVVVIVDDPDLGGDYRGGGEVAAPVFREIVLNTLRYLGVPSKNQANAMSQPVAFGKSVKVPELVGQSVDQASGLIHNAGMEDEAFGNGRTVVKQFPEQGTEMASGQRIYVLTEQPNKVPFPYLKGSSLRDAMAICSLFDADCAVSGAGYVSDQQISMKEGKVTVHLDLQPWDGQIQQNSGNSGGADSTAADRNSQDVSGLSAGSGPDAKPGQDHKKRNPG
ncbi:penicillin-binding transpeptidase domain-containing protein [Ferviditalea candida]|uniref:Penicillin-binding transpeptidase domain-containing protein n=1 Tax=Ferviditalea candida TaxID=3108399 RepID=A0ABU5ZG19_9BACL|nr:penicillin-binding transpeptidase domain-containing protein [Paenibacillaceae bacterium T2]